MIRRIGRLAIITAVLAVSIHLSAAMGTARDAKAVTVLTSLDVTQAMTEALAKGTSINVVNVVSKGYSMQGQDAYLKKRQKAFFETAAEATATITVAGAWPADPLYKWARRGNIHMVNIDATTPLDEYGAGVPLVEVEGEYSPFVWRSPANLTRMASIVSDDLCRLAPGDAPVIKNNLKRLQTELFKLRSKYEAVFLELDFVDLAAMTNGYTYLADEFGLDIHFYMLKPEAKWTEADAAQFTAKLKRDDVKAVICPWEPDAKGMKAIKDAGAVPVVLSRFDLKENTDPVVALAAWFDGNLSRLVSVLKD